MVVKCGLEMERCAPKGASWCGVGVVCVVVRCGPEGASRCGVVWWRTGGGELMWCGGEVVRCEVLDREGELVWFGDEVRAGGGRADVVWCGGEVVWW